MKLILLDITKYFIGVSSLLYVIVSIILWTKASTYFSLANRLLSIFFGVIAYNSFTFLLITSGFIKYVPFLYKIAFPLNYLPYPLAYLYIHVIIFNRQGLSRKDLLHFLPFFVTFIDYLPFYLIPIEEKRLIVDRLVSSGMESFLVDGSIIPISLHFLARGVLGIFYCYLMIALIRNYVKHQREEGIEISFPDHDKEVMQWLKKLVFWMVFLYVSYSLSIVLMELDVEFKMKFASIGIGLVLTSLTILFLAIHIFQHPNILYGIPIIPKEQGESEVSHSKSLVTKSRKKIETTFNWENLEEKIKNDKLFKTIGISLNEVAKIYELSPRTLSFLINNYKHQSFQNYFNELRIEYVLHLINEGKYLEQTIESIGLEAGFGSKSAFFSTFKKIKGCTPKEYILHLSDLRAKSFT